MQNYYIRLHRVYRVVVDIYCCSSIVHALRSTLETNRFMFDLCYVCNMLIYNTILFPPCATASHGSADALSYQINVMLTLTSTSAIVGIIHVECLFSSLLNVAPDSGVAIGIYPTDTSIKSCLPRHSLPLPSCLQSAVRMSPRLITVKKKT